MDNEPVILKPGDPVVLKPGYAENSYCTVQGESEGMYFCVDVLTQRHENDILILEFRGFDGGAYSVAQARMASSTIARASCIAEKLLSIS